MSAELAKRAVASKHWRWLPGMLAVGATGSSWPTQRIHIEGLPAKLVRDPRPDLEDPATLGCIELALLPAAYGCEPGDVRVYRCDAGRWWFRERLASYREMLNATSRAEALVCALESAP